MNKKNTKKIQDPKTSNVLPPLLFPAKSASEKSWMKQLKDEGRIRLVGPRLYASIEKSKLETVIRSCWSDIVGHLFPGALLSHRSALEYKPDPTGTIYLTSATNRKIEYPGLTLEFIRGPGPLEDDPAFRDFHASSTARALLENLSTTKSSRQRSLKPEVIEERLESELRVNGESGLNNLRDRARQIAGEMSWEREFKKLDEMIGAILGTRSSKILKTSIARARVAGRPFDLACNQKLEALFAELRSQPIPALKDNSSAADHFRNKAFFESYFSNYIEGTMFEIDEAEEIIFEEKIPEKRPRDAHDILSTYQIVSDHNEIRRCPESIDEFLEILKSRHSKLMAARPDVGPGEFKERPNRAGNTHFVDPELIEGTFEKGFQKYLELPKGLARAIFVMFLVAEVHPFNDGNGRAARIMMNAELQSQGLVTVIIPTVFRDDYLGGLRALSRRDRPEPIIRMIQRAQRFSDLEFSPYRKALSLLEKRNWFSEPREAKIIDSI